MAWGEFHVLTGVALQQASDGRWWIALPLAIMSHWALDDLNVGAVARVYHGIGEKWRMILTSLLRVPLVGALAWLFWHHPVYLICGLPAWLVLDHEWLVGALLGRHGYGLHERMWPRWLHGEWGLLPWFIAYGLMAMLIWR